MSFRILSLDGGGSWSLLQIMTLLDLYRSGGALLTGHHVLRDFDLVVATGSGSIVLGGLVKDLPLTEIRRFFEDAALRRSVFAPVGPQRNRLARLLGRPLRSNGRYSTSGKLDGLRRFFNSDGGEAAIGDTTLDALKTRIGLPAQVMILAFDYDRRRDVVFRSNLQSKGADFGTPPIATLAEAVHASTTAPLGFFDTPANVSRRRRCWDGALTGNNNPVLTAISEALANGVEPHGIEVLSIGTGSVVLPLAEGNEDAATAKLVRRRLPAKGGDDLWELADILLDDPPDTASLTAYLALGHAAPDDGAQRTNGGRLVRMNPLLQPIRVANGWVRPAGLIEAETGADEFVRLREIAIDSVADDEIALIKKFGTLWHGDAVVNQPIRANADTLECEIGQRWYNEARARWLALTGEQTDVSTPTIGPTTAPANWSNPPPRLGGSKVV